MMKLGSFMKIMKEVLIELLQAFRNNHPNEFFAYLGSDSGNVIDHYVVVPLFYQAPDSVSYRTDLLPMDFTIKGTIHSHPSLNPNPSHADLNSFINKGNTHIIVTYPYTIDTIHVYNKEGNPIKLEII